MLEETIAARKTTRPIVVLRGKIINVSATARRLDINQAYLSKILSGKRNPSLSILISIAKVLSFGIEDLLEAIEDRRKKILSSPPITLSK